MSMGYEEWKRILNAVNDDKDLTKDNVIEKIKEKLETEDKGEYEKWEKSGFDINYQFENKNEKCTLLHLAALFGNAKTANFLIKNDANINVKIDTGEEKWMTPLFCAVAKDHTEVVAILVANGANVDERIDEEEAKGWTPLHLAAQWGCTDIAKVLIENGANPLLKNKYGQTLRDLTTNDNIKNLLKEAEEKQLKKLNEEKNKLLQDGAKKGVFAGGVVVALGTAAAVALFATGTIAVELMPILIAIAAVTVAALTVDGITYMLSDPSVEQVAGNERKV